MSLNLLLALASHHTHHKSHTHTNTLRDTHTHTHPHVAVCSRRAYDAERRGTVMRGKQTERGDGMTDGSSHSSSQSEMNVHLANTLPGLGLHLLVSSAATND